MALKEKNRDKSFVSDAYFIKIYRQKENDFTSETWTSHMGTRISFILHYFCLRWGSNQLITPFKYRTLITVRRSDSQVLYRRAVFKNYAGKHLYGSHFFDEIAVCPTSCSFIKKETSVHTLSCEFDQIFH